MRYRVIIQPSAWSEISEAFRWLYERSPTVANRWRSGLLRAIRSLEIYPRRCSLARENDFFGEEIRQLLYGRTRGVYRVLFIVEEDIVSVLYVRQPLRPHRPDEGEQEEL